MRLVKILFAVLLLVSASLAPNLSSDTVSALSGSSFEAGNIISDSNFFNGDTLTTTQIQQFLDAKVPVCDTNGEQIYSGSTTRAAYGASRGYNIPYTCLKDYVDDVNAKSAEVGLCEAISAQNNRTAAEIINLVAEKCGVSQKVLLVLLQKEQALVTDDWPWSIQYRSATGYGCPDTAPCDSEYYGFFNQVYNAARIYRYYAKYSESFNHIAGETNYVLYNPNHSCGGRNVLIENQATAGLYNYTPYQPNSSALNNLYGTGNSCSAYGNRNFWRLYNDWFGDPTSDPKPTITIVGDWDGDGVDTVGYKQGNYYYIDDNNDSVIDYEFGIGRDSDEVIVGDWDGDGDEEIGLKRGNYYYFDTDHDGSAEISFGIGRVTDQTIVGDWNGDGSDNIGLKRGKYYYLDTNNNRTADITFGIGRETDKVIIGDWDGDGAEEVGLRRGNHYYYDSDHDGKADVSFGLGRTTDKILIGDWDGDGSDNIGLKRDKFYYLDTNNDRTADIYFGIGRTTDTAYAKDWDGDGSDEIGLKRYIRYYYDTDKDGIAEISHTLDIY